MLDRIRNSFLVLIGKKIAIDTNTFIAKRGDDVVVSIDGPELETALIAVWVLSQNPHYWTFTDLGQAVLKETLEHTYYEAYDEYRNERGS